MLSYLEKYKQACDIVYEKAKDFGLTREEVEDAVAKVSYPTAKETSKMAQKLLSQLNSINNINKH